MWLEACPDASVTYTRTDSGAYVVALQRRLGLYMSTARSVNDGVLDAGGEPDYTSATSRATLASTRKPRVARRACRRGRRRGHPRRQKEKAGEYKKYNEGHVCLT
jgi:hypothetical protein